MGATNTIKRFGSVGIDYSTNQLILYEGDSTVRFKLNAQRLSDLRALLDAVNDDRIRGD